MLTLDQLDELQAKLSAVQLPVYHCNEETGGCQCGAIWQGEELVLQRGRWDDTPCSDEKTVKAYACLISRALNDLPELIAMARVVAEQNAAHADVVAIMARPPRVVPSLQELMARAEADVADEFADDAPEETSGDLRALAGIPEET